MTTKKKLTIIRHGQTTSNITGKQSPISTLTTTGIEQCLELNQKLKNANAYFDVVFVSPYIRATSTFDYVFNGVQIGSHEIADELREFEQYDKMTYEDQFKPMDKSTPKPLVKDSWLLPETEEDFFSNRLCPFLFQKILKCPGTNIAIVGHCIFFRYLQQFILHTQKLEETTIIRNCEYMCFDLFFGGQKEQEKQETVGSEEKTIDQLDVLSLLPPASLEMSSSTDIAPKTSTATEQMDSLNKVKVESSTIKHCATCSCKQ